MMTSTEHSLDALTALIEERRKYERWLAQIESRRATTPEHVFERVRSDYMTRLTTVSEQLLGRAAELDDAAATLARQLQELHETAATRRDERTEAELRAAVGEFSEDEAAEVFSRCDAELSTLEERRSAVGGELARMQGIIAESRRKTPTPSSVPAVAPPTPEPVAAAPVGPRSPTLEPVVAEDSRVSASAAPVGDEPSTVREPDLSTTPQPDVVSAGDPGNAPGFDELAFLHSVVGPSDAEPEAATAQQREPATASVPTTEMFQPPRTPVSRPAISRESAGPASPVVPTLTPGSLPAFIKDMPTEQIKTLKCQECGTMNYPTEWYCERCGGELAAM